MAAGPFALAQEAAKHAHEKLVLGYVEAKLQRAAEATRIRASAAYEAAVTAHDYTAQQALFAGLPNPEEAFRERFEAGCIQFAGTPGEALFLGWLLENIYPPRGEASKYAVALVARHATHEIWKSLAPNAVHYFGKDPTKELARLLAESPFEQVRAWIRYSQSKQVLRSRASTKLQRDAARSEQQNILKEYPDSVPGMRIGAEQFEKTRLQVGMVSPEINGLDTDGNALRLTDYRGKVVLLDFWGDW